ncbi:recombinase family protein [Streptomyces echinoruber]|nr:recombinase family protein [Streptomyces echinoruber]
MLESSTRAGHHDVPDTFLGVPPEDLVDLYVRKSVKVSGHRRDLSTDAQEALGRRWAAREGKTVRWVWKDILSGYKDIKRPDYDKALASVVKGEVGTLWCYRVDRWSRKGARSVLDILEPADGSPPRRLVFHDDYLDSSNPRDRRQIINRAEDAREESERISHRVKDTKNYQRDQGMWVAGKTPYGLAMDPKTRKLIRDLAWAIPRGEDDEPPAGIPEELANLTKADVAERIHREARTGKRSSRDISNGLNDDGIPSASGGRWSPGVVYHIVQNPVYAGWQITHTQPNGRGKRIRYRNERGELVRVGVDLVTDAQLREAQAALAGLKLPQTEGKVRDGLAKHLLTDILTCAGCDGAMCWDGRSYQCNKDKVTPCPEPASAMGTSLEAYVVKRWKDQLTNADLDDPLLVAVAQRWASHEAPKETEDIQAARVALAQADASLKRLMEDRQAGHYDGPASRYFPQLLADANKAVTDAQETMNKLGGGLKVDISFLLEPESLDAAWADADLAFRRDLLRLAIDDVRVTKLPEGAQKRFKGDDRVTVTWATPEVWVAATPQDEAVEAELAA